MTSHGRSARLGRRRRRRRRPWIVPVLVVLAGTAALVGAGPGSAASSPGAGRQVDGTDAELVARGRALYATGCVSCHGSEGQGQRAPNGALRGPSLVEAGAAGAYYQLTTGRMPLADPQDLPTRKEPAYDPDEIEALVAYVASLGDGPERPQVDLDRGDLAEGGVLYRENCQACHSATGAGGALSYGRAAPPLAAATPEQVGTAVRSGPGPMPRFGDDILTDQQLDSVARYVAYLEEPDDRGGLALGRLGPIPEGFMVWVGALGLLLVAAYFMGTRWATARRVDPEPPMSPEEPTSERGCLGCGDTGDRSASRMSRGHDPGDAERGEPSPTAEEQAAARRAEMAVAAGFLISTAGAIGLAVTYWRGGQPQLEGLFLALALGGLGVGFILWSKRFMPHEPVVEARHPIASTEEEVAAFREEFERGEVILTRRKLLVRSAGAAIVALGAALLFPLRSLGPRPGRGLKDTPFRAGTYLVTADNQRVRATDVNVNGVLTVFPEVEPDPDHPEVPPRPAAQADAPTLLIRPDIYIRPRPGREDWTAEGLVAYSKLCTHVGCPVGLYQADEHLLLCPCHQSTFDVLDGARPVFGPATRSLPQLPIEVDADGYLYATGDFSGPTGPGFWDRDR